MFSKSTCQRLENLILKPDEGLENKFENVFIQWCNELYDHEHKKGPSKEKTAEMKLVTLIRRQLVKDIADYFLQKHIEEKSVNLYQTIARLKELVQVAEAILSVVAEGKEKCVATHQLLFLGSNHQNKSANQIRRISDAYIYYLLKKHKTVLEPFEKWREYRAFQDETKLELPAAEKTKITEKLLSSFNAIKESFDENYHIRFNVKVTEVEEAIMKMNKELIEKYRIEEGNKIPARSNNDDPDFGSVADAANAGIGFALLGSALRALGGA